MAGLGYDAYKLTFQISPIILTGGIASSIPGGGLPIIAITEALNFPIGLLSGGISLSLDSFFANFEPLPGGTFIDQQIGSYPFANQAVAANAVIAQPLGISMLMVCPVKDTLGYATKLATMMALKATLAQHNASGGTYTVATPSNFFDNCVMLRMIDVSSGQSKQVQHTWRFDFVQPLLTLQQAQQAQNNLMGRLSSGTQVNGDPPAWSGLSPATGSTVGATSPAVVPAASNTGASQIAGSYPMLPSGSFSGSSTAPVPGF